MYLVLCASTDISGLWVYQGLKQLGVAPIELLLAEWLARDTRWEHRLDRSGVHLKITLADGRVLCGSRIRGAINRLSGPSPLIAQQAAESDREYAQAELQAFYLSWMNGLPGVVINRPTTVGLCGAWYHASEWALRAGRAGLPVQTYRQSGHDAPEQFYRPQAPQGAAIQSFITCGGAIFGGQLPESVGRACAQLAAEAGEQILGIDLYRDASGQWTFAGASPTPDLTIGGLPLLQRLAKELTQGDGL